MSRKRGPDHAGEVDTLVVFCTNRGDYVLRDQIDALHWAHRQPHAIVAVDDTRPLDVPVESGASPYGPGVHHVIPSRLIKGRLNLCGFKNLEAVRWALDEGIDFRACLSVDDDALPIGRGLDEWALARLANTGVDLLGVEDRVSYQPGWRDICNTLANWLPAARTPKCEDDVDPHGVFFAVLWLSRALCDAMHAGGLLVPRNYEIWWTWPDVYISYVAQLLDLTTATWGHMDDPRPPVYANHRNHMRSAPAPTILRDDFLIYHPIRHVTRRSEEDLRRHYAGLRRPPGS